MFGGWSQKEAIGTIRKCPEEEIKRPKKKNDTYVAIACPIELR
jgi:hypothetical protein